MRLNFGRTVRKGCIRLPNIFTRNHMHAYMWAIVAFSNFQNTVLHSSDQATNVKILPLVTIALFLLLLNFEASYFSNNVFYPTAVIQLK